MVFSIPATREFANYPVKLMNNNDI
jgi:hypothetical protein